MAFYNELQIWNLFLHLCYLIYYENPFRDVRAFPNWKKRKKS